MTSTFPYFLCRIVLVGQPSNRYHEILQHLQYSVKNAEIVRRIFPLDCELLAVCLAALSTAAPGPQGLCLLLLFARRMLEDDKRDV